jgi:hypothetical protein
MLCTASANDHVPKHERRRGEYVARKSACLFKVELRAHSRYCWDRCRILRTGRTSHNEERCDAEINALKARVSRVRES